MLCLEWWFWELASLTAGAFGTHSLAVHAVVSIFVPCTYMIPLGVSIATATRVGNFIGSGSWIRARWSALTGLSMAIVAACIYSLPLAFFGHHLSRVITSEGDVLKSSARLFPIAAGFLLVDGYQGVVRYIFVE